MTAIVAAVVVTFNPDLDRLAKALDAISQQVGAVLVVDNGSAVDIAAWASAHKLDNVVFVRLRNNCGIAAAQNVGIHWAKTEGFEFVVLMDQDSIAAPDMVEKLMKCHLLLAKMGRRAAIVGPRFRDSKQGVLSHFVKIGFLRIRSVNECEETLPGVVEVDFLISSGALVSMQALDAVGMMDESLFIDHVDTEWCLRAKSRGWQLYGATNALMDHTLGEQRREIWLFRRRVIPFHKPFRYYYIYRNSVLLYQRAYMPLRWKLADAARCLKMAVVFSMMSENARECLSMMWRGTVDGCRGKTGKMPT